MTIPGLEDITPPEPPRVARWTCQEEGCDSWNEGGETLVIYLAEQHWLTTHAAPGESLPEEPESEPEPEPEPEDVPQPGAPEPEPEIVEDEAWEYPAMPDIAEEVPDDVPE